MKALILGANGQLGRALRKRFPDSLAYTREQLDVTDLVVLEAFDWGQIDTILNASAYTNVDGAQTAEGREQAWKINAQAVSWLTRIAIKHDLTLVQGSTDYVFDGRQALHTEDEPVTPLGVYGQSKAAGDFAASIVPKHYNLRGTWLIGDGPNFVRTMVGVAAKNISPSVVDDQIGRLTFTGQLVDGIEHLLKIGAPYGLYNLTNDGEPASWAEVTQTILTNIGRDDLTVTGTTTEEYFKKKPEAAPRPLQSTMDLSKIKATGLRVRDWRDDLKEYLKLRSTKE